MEPAICVQQLGKKYPLGTQHGSRRTLRRALHQGLRRPALPAPGEARKEFWAIQDVSFDVRPGEVLGIVGRNGAGKSTLLKLLSQITEPTTGRIVLNGRVASLLEVGTGFHPELTGRENIFLNGALLGMTRVEIKTHFDEIVAFSEIDDFLDMPVKRYSSGMYVRLAFAIAAHLTSEILIIDEVLAVGDGGFQARCLGKMRDVGRSGRTVLFVSHDAAAVQALCTRALWLQAGRVAADGAVADVMADYVRTLQQAGRRQALPAAVDANAPEITKFVLLDESESEAQVVPFHSSLTVDFRFRMPVRSRELCFNMQLMSEDGRLKGTVASGATACPAFDKAGQYAVRINLPRFAALPGRYEWTVQFWRPGERNPLASYSGLFPFEVMVGVLPGARSPYLTWAGEFHLESTIDAKQE